MAFQDHHHLSQQMPLHYPDHHHPAASAALFRSILPDHHHSPDDKPQPPQPAVPATNTWLHHPHQWLTTQSQPSPPTPPDNNDHHQESGGGDSNSNGNNTNWEREKCKADILSHPLYEQLLSAHVACLRIATPVDQLPRIDAQLAQSQQVVAKYSVLGHGHPLDDKDLDHFMTHYVLLLSSFKEQLQQHVRVHAMEAVMACWELEQSLQSLTGVAPGEGTGATMSDDDEDQADSDTNLFDESLDGPDSLGFGPLVKKHTHTQYVILQLLLCKTKPRKMMQPEILMPSGPIFNLTCSNQYMTCNQEMDFFDIDDHDFSSSFASPEESSVISSNSYDQTMFQDEFLDLQNLCDEYQIMSSVEGLETISSAEFMEIGEWINETGDGNSRPPSGDQELSSCVSFEPGEISVVGMSMSLPGTEMELDDELRLHHLLMAHAEATENGEKDLADVLVKSTNEKSSPTGSTMERVAFSLFQFKEKRTEYLRLESIKNSIEAFMVFYQVLPIGRFAHLTANSAIIEAMPSDAAEVHVIDFDIGEGIQWAPLLEALSWKNKSLKLTSVKLEGECTSSFWDIEETKKRLQGHAKQYNCKLQIEEKSMEDVVNELTRMNKREQGREWLVFNCMVGLPHMARRRPRSQVLEFLKVAKELLSKFAGILTLGDGEEGYGLNTCSSYQSFFDKLLRHYQALFESLEKNFPSYMAAARTTIESLFLAPFMSPSDWFQDWEEMMKSYNVQEGIGLEGRELSKESLAEAKEMVHEREGAFQVKVEGYREHEMVLEWKDTPLVRVSTWM